MGSSLCSGLDLTCGSGSDHVMEQSLLHTPPLVTGSYNLVHPLLLQGSLGGKQEASLAGR